MEPFKARECFSFPILENETDLTGGCDTFPDSYSSPPIAKHRAISLNTPWGGGIQSAKEPPPGGELCSKSDLTLGAPLCPEKDGPPAGKNTGGQV